MYAVLLFALHCWCPFKSWTRFPYRLTSDGTINWPQTCASCCHSLLNKMDGLITCNYAHSKFDKGFISFVLSDAVYHATWTEIGEPFRSCHHNNIGFLLPPKIAVFLHFHMWILHNAGRFETQTVTQSSQHRPVYTKAYVYHWHCMSLGARYLLYIPFKTLRHLSIWAWLWRVYLDAHITSALLW